MEDKRRRRKAAPILAVAGLGAALLLALATLGTLSGFTASINNSANSTASGTLLMEEDQGATVCTSTTGTGAVIGTNAGTCSTINKFGGSTTAVPGQIFSQTVTIKNVGTTNAGTFTLTPSACTQAANGSINGTATDLCAKVFITIQEVGATSCVYPANPTTACPATPTSSGTLTSLAGGGALSLGAMNAGASRDYKFTVMLDSAAGNTYQGLSASQPLLWSFAT
jgi:hypothetical protein